MAPGAIRAKIEEHRADRRRWALTRSLSSVSTMTATATRPLSKSGPAGSREAGDRGAGPEPHKGDQDEKEATQEAHAAPRAPSPPRARAASRSRRRAGADGDRCEG